MSSSQANKLFIGGFATLSMGVLSAAFMSGIAYADTADSTPVTTATQETAAASSSEAATTPSTGTASTPATSAPSVAAAQASSSPAASTLAVTAAVAPTTTAAASTNPITATTSMQFNTATTLSAGSTASGYAVVNISGSNASSQNPKIILSVPKQYVSDFSTANSIVANSTERSETDTNFLVTYSFDSLQTGQQFAFPFSVTSLEPTLIPNGTVVPVTVIVVDADGNVLSTASQNITYTNNAQELADVSVDAGGYNKNISGIHVLYPDGHEELTQGKTYVSDKLIGVYVDVTANTGRSDGQAYYNDPSYYVTIEVPDYIKIEDLNPWMNTLSDILTYDEHPEDYEAGVKPTFDRIRPYVQKIYDDLSAYFAELGQGEIISHENGKIVYRMPKVANFDINRVAEIYQNDLMDLLEEEYQYILAHPEELNNVANGLHDVDSQYLPELPDTLQGMIDLVKSGNYTREDSDTTTSQVLYIDAIVKGWLRNITEAVGAGGLYLGSEQGPEYEQAARDYEKVNSPASYEINQLYNKHYRGEISDSEYEEYTAPIRKKQQDAYQKFMDASFVSRVTYGFENIASLIVEDYNFRIANGYGKPVMPSVRATLTQGLPENTTVTATIALHDADGNQIGNNKSVDLFKMLPTQYTAYYLSQNPYIPYGLTGNSFYPDSRDYAKSGTLSVSDATNETNNGYIYNEISPNGVRWMQLSGYMNQVDRSVYVEGLADDATYTLTITTPREMSMTSFGGMLWTVWENHDFAADGSQGTLTDNGDGTHTYTIDMNKQTLVDWMSSKTQTSVFSTKNIADGTYAVTYTLKSSDGVVNLPADTVTINVHHYTPSPSTPIGLPKEWQGSISADTTLDTSILWDDTDITKNYFIVHSTVDTNTTTFAVNDDVRIGDKTTRDLTVTQEVKNHKAHYYYLSKIDMGTVPAGTQVTVTYADNYERVLGADELNGTIYTIRDAAEHGGVRSYRFTIPDLEFTIAGFGTDEAGDSQNPETVHYAKVADGMPIYNVRTVWSVMPGTFLTDVVTDQLSSGISLADIELTQGLADTREFASQLQAGDSAYVETNVSLPDPAYRVISQYIIGGTAGMSRSDSFRVNKLVESVNERLSAFGGYQSATIMYKGNNGVEVPGTINASYSFNSMPNKAVYEKIQQVRPDLAANLQLITDAENTVVYNVYVMPKQVRYTVKTGTVVQNATDADGNSVVVMASDEFGRTELTYSLDGYLLDGTYTIKKFAVANRAINGTGSPTAVTARIFADQYAYSAGQDNLTILRVKEMASDFAVQQNGGTYQKDVTIKADEPYHYIASLINNTDHNLTDYVVYATLPTPGDTLVLTDESRGSTGTAVLTGALEDDPRNADALADLEFLYTVDTPNKDVLANNFVTKDQVTDWSTVTGVLIRVKDGHSIAAHSASLIAIPVQLTNLNSLDAKAVMSSAVSFNGTDFFNGAYATARPDAYTLTLTAWIDQNSNGVKDAGEETGVAGTWTVYNEDGTVARDLFGNEISAHVESGTASVAIYTAGKYYAQLTPDNPDGNLVFNKTAVTTADDSALTSDITADRVIAAGSVATTRAVEITATHDEAGLGVAMLVSGDEIETTPIAYPVQYIDDPTLEAGMTIVVTPGVEGEILTHYEMINGTRTGRSVTERTEPVTEVIRRGTRIDRYLDESGRQIHEPGNHLGQLEISGYWFVKADTTSRNNGTDYIYRLIVQKSGDPLSYDLPELVIPDVPAPQPQPVLEKPDQPVVQEKSKPSGPRHAATPRHAAPQSALAQTGSDVANMAAGMLGFLVAGLGAVAARRKKDNE